MGDIKVVNVLDPRCDSLERNTVAQAIVVNADHTVELVKEPKVVTPKKKKTFKEYYDTDPVFRERHNNHLKEKIPCPRCGKVVRRYNLTAHKRTNRCIAMEATQRTAKEKEWEAALALALEIVKSKNPTIKNT